MDWLLHASAVAASLNVKLRMPPQARIPLAAVLSMAALAGCEPNCENKRVADVLSPDRSHKAAVYSSLCGFNIASNTQLSILPAADSAHGRSNVFGANVSGGETARGPHGGPLVSARWLDDRTLEIAYDTAASVIWREERLDDFIIRYRSLAVPPAAAPARVKAAPR